MADDKQQEYENLKSQQRATRRKYTASRDRIEEYEYRIRRLKIVKETVEEQKSRFKALKKEDERIIEAKRSWEGETKKTFVDKGSSMIDENNYYYKYSLDYVLDALNDEITRLENKKYAEYGVLGNLVSLLNSLANKIENFFN